MPGIHTGSSGERLTHPFLFGPVWVWLAYGEEPTAPTLIGGAVILVAVVSMAAASSGGPGRKPNERLPTAPTR